MPWRPADEARSANRVFLLAAQECRPDLWFLHAAHSDLHILEKTYATGRPPPLRAEVPDPIGRSVADLDLQGPRGSLSLPRGTPLVRAWRGDGYVGQAEVHLRGVSAVVLLDPLLRFPQLRPKGTAPAGSEATLRVLNPTALTTYHIQDTNLPLPGPLRAAWGEARVYTGNSPNSTFAIPLTEGVFRVTALVGGSPLLQA
jgi:hypothetical protein